MNFRMKYHALGINEKPHGICPYLSALEEYELIAVWIRHCERRLHLQSIN
jgi:hypothetical protein